MANDTKLEQLIYNLSKKSNGQSKKLFEFFGVSDTEIEAILPVTKLQRDMIVDLLLDPSILTYNICIYIEVSHKIDANLWHSIITDYAEKNYPQRTRFLIKDSLFYQAVYRNDFISFEYVDFSNNGFTHEKIHSYFNDQNQKLFDITQDNLCRNYLLKVAEDKYCIGISGHHVVFDGYSGVLILQDLLNKYESIISGTEFEFPERTPFKDYVFYNNDVFDSSTILDFWENKSKHIFPLNPLFNEEGGSAERTNLSLIINAEELKQIKKYCWNKKITIPIFFKSIYCLLIKYYFQTENDFIVYENFNNRGKEFGDSIGEYLYVQPNIIRNEALSISGSINDIYEDIKGHRKETKNQYISMSAFTTLNKNQKILPFFNYFIIPELSFLNQNIEPGFFDNSGENELYFYIRERKDHLEVFFFFSTHHFNDNHFLNRFHSLVQQVISHDDVLFSNLQYILKQEQIEIQQKFNSNKTALSNKLFPVLFEEQAAKLPDRIALQYQERSLTYKQLNNLVNCLVESLVSVNNVQTQEPVGVFMERSDFFLVAFLGVLKAGAIYVPIDTKYPVSRVSYIIKETGMKTIITDRVSSLKFDKIGVNIILIEDILPLSEKVCPNPNISISTNDIAYIIFTSGSTGKPKGAIVEHIGMLNHLYAKINDLNIDSSAVIAQNASQSFDISIWQFLTALICGGKTIVYGDEVILNTPEFVGKISNDCVNILEVVPSYLSVVLDQVEQKGSQVSFKELNYLLVTGETIQQNLLQKWFLNYPNIKVVNAYGPTEASDDITHFIMDQCPFSKTIPIGKPIQNMDIFILDDFGRLCPPGIKGEICVSGIGVGRGYLNDAEKTNLAFINNAFIEGETRRYYKTGDLGCYTHEGFIEFYGRKDYQVKIRGHRIELAEIEYRLVKLPEIKEVLVIDKTNNAGLKYLIAYITLEANSNITTESLRESLSRDLPEYMIPSYFEIIEQFPLTPNGKIDRKALPEPNHLIINTQAFVAPTNKIEKRLAQLWSQILETEISTIGINNNFFDLGGHSLAAIKLMNIIHKEFNAKISYLSFFQNPTLKALSGLINEQNGSTFKSIQCAEKKEYYPVSSSQKRIYLAQMMSSDNVHYNIPVIIPLNKPDEIKLKEAIYKLVERHESLRTSFQLINDQIVQKIHNVKELNIVVQIVDCKETEIQYNIDNFVQKFDLTFPPLFRIKLLKIENKKHLLMIDIHHIISDEAAFKVLVNDFLMLYSGVELEPLKIQYKDYTEWHNTEKESARYAQQELYWTEQFSDKIPMLELPIDFNRPNKPDYNGSSVRFILDREISAELLKLCSDESVTTFMLMFSIYNIFLHKIAGQDDIVVGIPVLDKGNVELEKVIGLFVNMLPIRLNIDKDKTFVDFLAHVKEKLAISFDNQECQFDDIVDKVLKSRDYARNPLFDVVFSFEEPYFNKVQEPKNDEIKNEQDKFDFMVSTAKYDLTLVGSINSNNNFELTFEYKNGLFRKETIENFINYVNEIISLIVRNKLIKINDIRLSHNYSETKLVGLSELEGGFGF